MVRALRVDHQACDQRVGRKADIIGVGSTDFALVRVQTRDWPGSVETETLKAFAAPPPKPNVLERLTPLVQPGRFKRLFG
jgi:hypothetical protein